MITRPAPVTPAKQRATAHIRRLAQDVKRTFPDMDVHEHLTDAARELDAGRTDNAKRHIDAAMHGFTPLSLIRHGIHDDTGHMAAKAFMQRAHRGRLLAADVEHMQGANEGLAEHRRDQAAAAQQAKAMRNAQPAPAGRTGADVAAPDAPERPGSKQLANGPQPYHRGADETVTCPYCGKGDAPDAVYCDQCGRKLPDSAFADLSWGGVISAVELAATPPHETMAGRRALKAKGQTAYGTSFPVPNVAYLKKAIHSIGRAPAEKRGQLKAFLKRRAAALGASHLAANLTADELAMIDLAVSGGQMIELVGPHGYVHGWIKVGAGQATNNDAAKYHGADGMRGDLGGGKGVVVGTYNHRAHTITDRRGASHKVIAVDPTAHDAGFNSSVSRSHLPPDVKQALTGYGREYRAGAVTKRIKKEARAQAGGSLINFANAVELVGPKGYSHGWVYHGKQGFQEGKAGPFGKHLSKKEARGFADMFRQGETGTLGSRWRPGEAAEIAASGAGFPLEAQRLPKRQREAYTRMRAMGHPHNKALSIARRVGAAIGRATGAGSVTESITQYAWEDVLDAIELSADTGRLASTPHPFGKPGGPGLWNVKNMELPPYIQNIARALLRTGRAKSLSQAIAIAKGATNRWSRGGGHVSPEVRAASAKTNADWDAKRAVAHAHTNNEYQWDVQYLLTGTAAGAAKDSRTPLGQFGTGGQGAQGGQKTRAQRKAALLAQAKQDRAQARLLLIRIRADRAALASASGKVSKGQKGSTTKATASTTKSGAPAAKGAAKAAASPTSNAATGLTPQRLKAATAQATAQARSMSKQQLLAAIKSMSAQEQALLKKAAADVAQAAKL